MRGKTTGGVNLACHHSRVLIHAQMHSLNQNALFKQCQAIFTRIEQTLSSHKACKRSRCPFDAHERGRIMFSDRLRSPFAGTVIMCTILVYFSSAYTYSEEGGVELTRLG